MTRDGMTKEAFDSLLEDIMNILLDNGLKATTMGSIAKSLKMSKRTLYEIFSSKSQMVEEAIIASHTKMMENNRKIFQSSGNVMESMLKCFMAQRDFMSRVNVNFFRDTDTLFAKERKKSDFKKMSYFEDFVKAMQRGVEEGYFRKDVNFLVQCRMFSIQMESLKRMEELFPPDITLLEAYDSIYLAFLRGIATPKGMEELDKLIANYRTKKTSHNNNKPIFYENQS